MGQLQTIGSHRTTVARDSDGVLRVTYHSTPVVTVYPNGRIDLNTGGYFTHTTKTRMNQASNQLSLGFRVFQKDFAWYVDIDGQTIPFDGNYKLTIRNGS